jgi:hypothetical protein
MQFMCYETVFSNMGGAVVSQYSYGESILLPLDSVPHVVLCLQNASVLSG